jgi:small nuclear ribonucleoprotein (snRNP)-like protein
MDFGHSFAYAHQAGPFPSTMQQPPYPPKFPRPAEIMLDSDTIAVGATLTLFKDPEIALPDSSGLGERDAVFLGPAGAPAREDVPCRERISLIDLLHPAARQLCKKSGSHHSTLVSLLDSIIGFGVAVTTACGRRYHGLLASAEDADMSLILEECVQEEKERKGQHKGVMVIPGSNILSIELSTPEPVPLFDPCTEEYDYSAAGAHMTILLKGYHTWPFPDAASASAYSPSAPECVRYLTDLRKGVVPRPVSMALDGAPTPGTSANAFQLTKHHHGHVMVLNGLVSATTGARKLGKGAAYTPGATTGFR